MNNDTESLTAFRIAFFGTPEFAVPGLKALLEHDQIDVAVVVTQPDRPAGRGKKIQLSPVKKIAVEYQLPLIQPENIRKSKEEFLEELNKFKPLDLGIVIAFGQILPLSLLNFPKHGCLNIHASLLPRWRGAAPIQRAIMAGDKVTGVALMSMREGLDCGPVYCHTELPISDQDNFQSLHDKLSRLGADLLSENVTAICRGEITAREQAGEGVTRAPKVTSAEASIDWSESAKKISRQIRGLSPFPGAYTVLNQKRLKIHKATPKNPLKSGPCEPGRISSIDTKMLEIQCGEGVLSLEEVQLEGKKRLPVEEFLRGVSLDDTVILG